MLFAVKLPLEVQDDQALSIEGQSKILNWAFNHLLETANTKIEELKKTKDPEVAQLLLKTIYSEKGLRNLLPALKKEKPFLCAVHSVPLKNAAIRLSKSIRRFQENKKKPKKEQIRVGWPKFRSSKRKFFSLLYDEPGNGFQFEYEPMQGWSLRLSLGKDENGQRVSHQISVPEMPLWLSEAILEAQRVYPELRKSKTTTERKKFHLRDILPFSEARIKREGSRWFVTLSIERAVRKPLEEVQKVAVIDPNHKNLGYLVDSEGKAIEIANLSFVKGLDRRIDEVKSRRDECNRNSKKIERSDGSVFYKPSRKWKFFQDYLDELHRIKREQIKFSLYAFSNELIKEYDLIAVGNYTPHGGGISTGMRRSMNNQSQIGKFKQTLKWVCQREGKLYFEWDERNSTKTCNHCGTPTQLTQDPSVRAWKCSVCHRDHIRDENAALNGFKPTIEWIKQNKVPCSGHLELTMKDLKSLTVNSRWAWRFTGSGVSTSRARECVGSQTPRN
jgi:putative transposase